MYLENLKFETESICRFLYFHLLNTTILGEFKSNCLLKSFGQKPQHFSNDTFQSYYDLFQVN